VKIDPDFGDAWAYFYKFELQYGTEVTYELTYHLKPANKNQIFYYWCFCTGPTEEYH
jgi:pre-mRNA-processing factor 6